jgi:hypothetical protein
MLMIEHPTDWRDLLYDDEHHRDRARACIGAGWSRDLMAMIASVLTDNRIDDRHKIMLAMLIAGSGPNLDRPRADRRNDLLAAERAVDARERLMRAAATNTMCMGDIAAITMAIGAENSSVDFLQCTFTFDLDLNDARPARRCAPRYFAAPAPAAATDALPPPQKAFGRNRELVRSPLAISNLDRCVERPRRGDRSRAGAITRGSHGGGFSPRGATIARSSGTNSMYQRGEEMEEIGPAGSS